MYRRFLLGAMLISLASPARLCAEEQVTLKSGTRLIGTVTLNGQTVKIKIGDSRLEIPLGDVELISSVGTESKQSPERLLMIALEARAQQGSSASHVGLLAEAYRQAPDDARIAYWYAQSLADAGLGSAAQTVLQKHRADIEAMFPGMTQRLAKQIQERIELEHLPTRLATRIEQLTKASETVSLRSDRLPMFVRFRLTDSTGQPVEKSAFSIRCNGNDERLEAFDGGYYLFTFNSYRNNDDPACKLTVSSPGLHAQEFTLQPAADYVPNAGNLVVRRYGDADKLALTVHVVDHSGKSVANASVTLQPQNRNDGSAVQTESTNAEGRATFKVFPMKYTYKIAAKGFKSESDSIELKRNSNDQQPVRVELHPAIAATIRYVWSMTSPQGGETTSRETTLEAGEGNPPIPYSHDTIHLLRPVQVGGKLTLQSGPPYRGGAMVAPPWVRRAPADEVADAPLQFFKSIDLQKLDEVKDKWDTVDIAGPNLNRGSNSPLSFEVEQGDIYVGEVPGRDMRSGQPTLVSFKAFIEKVSAANESD